MAEKSHMCVARSFGTRIMAATVAKDKEKHAKMPHQPHHLSRATATQDGWVESLTSLTESVAATRLLDEVIPLKARRICACICAPAHCKVLSDSAACYQCMQEANGSCEIQNAAELSEEEAFEVRLSHAVKTLASEVLLPSPWGPCNRVHALLLAVSEHDLR